MRAKRNSVPEFSPRSIREWRACQAPSWNSHLFNAAPNRRVGVNSLRVPLLHSPSNIGPSRTGDRPFAARFAIKWTYGP